MRWRHALEQRVARLDAFWRICAWVQTFEQARPGLRDGPPWGYALDALVQWVPDAVDDEAGIPRPRRRRARPEHPERRPWAGLHHEELETPPKTGRCLTRWPATARDPVGGHPEDRSAPLGGTESQASHSRSAHPWQTGPQPRPPRSTPVDGPPSPDRRPSTPATARPMPISSSPPAPVLEPEAHVEWMRSLVRRAQRPLRSLPRTVPDGAPPAAEPGALPLSGVQAPFQLLTRLAGGADGDGRDRGRHHQSSGGDDGAETPVQGEPVPDGRASRAEGSPLQPSSPRADATAGFWGTIPPGDVSSFYSSRASPLGEIPAASRRATNASGGAASQSASSRPGTDSPFRIAPPALASSLPPLVSPRTRDTPPYPLATVVARLGANTDEFAAPEEGITQLADRIKRILDEEARRHGIDV